MKNENRQQKFTRKEFLRIATGALTMGMVSVRTRAETSQSIQTRTLGRTGLQVTPICFGASRTQEPSLIRMALDKGINFIDTGRQYAGGQNEQMLGETLQNIREEVVIQSKIRLRLRGNMLSSAQADSIITGQMTQSLEESLQALRTDYIDVMLLHSAPSLELTYHPAVMEFFEQAKSSGKIRAHGFSVHNEEMDIIEAATKNPFYDVMMMPYNHRGGFVHSQNGRTSEWDQPLLERYLERLSRADVGLIAMKTCSGGPYAGSGAANPSFSGAVQWVLRQKYIHSANVAMVTYDEVEEDLKALS